MNSDINPGLNHNLSFQINDRLLVTAFLPEFPGFSDAPPVFATAFMVGFLEWACIEALRPYLPDGERTVGNHVYLSHIATPLMDMKLTAQVELVEVKSRSLRFRVDCFADGGLVASGFHERTRVSGTSIGTKVLPKSARRAPALTAA